jgi:hypothetical protein
MRDSINERFDLEGGVEYEADDNMVDSSGKKKSEYEAPKDLLEGYSTYNIADEGGKTSALDDLLGMDVVPPKQGRVPGEEVIGGGGNNILELDDLLGGPSQPLPTT